MQTGKVISSKNYKLFWNNPGDNSAVVGQATPDMKTKRSSSSVVVEDLPLTHCPNETISGRFPPTTCGNDTNLMDCRLARRGFTRPSSPRSVSSLSSRDVAPLPSSRKVFIRDIRGAFGGFTLIELLVVVLIIGILAAVAVPQYQKAVDKSRAMQLITAAKAIYEAKTRYYLANGTYPTDPNEVDIDFPGTISGSMWIINSHTVCKLYSTHLMCELDSPPIRWLLWNSDENPTRGRCYAVGSNNTRGDKVCQSLTGQKGYYLVGDDHVYSIPK